MVRQAATTQSLSCPAPPSNPTRLQVSSFSTQADTRLIPLDASVHMIGRQKSKDAVRRSTCQLLWML